MRSRAASTTPDDLQQKAQRLTMQLLSSASRHFGKKIRAPAIRFDLRGKAAGQVRTVDGHTCLIRYNHRLLERHPKEFLVRTVPHETAHVVAFSLFGSRIQPHGAEWQTVMALFGASPERCHNYNIEGLQTRRLRRYEYRCECRIHQLTSIRHNRIRSGQIYHCRECGRPLEQATAVSAD